jgi:1-acyl-sn-glycerol-3-phosphate acyltransferase
MRRLLTAILRLVSNIFFRDIEIVGHVPDDVPVIFAVNHPNGLVDPLFLLCFAPRPVSFLGKAPLLKMPVIGSIVRALDTIPVYRKQDNVAGSNRETFARARAVLACGGSIAIFPEGTTHGDSKLRELKTGAARIALGAAMERVAIVPTGLYYSSKQMFRSSAVMEFGAAIEVQPVEADEPPRDAVDGLTARIERALADVTLQADSRQALELIARAETIFSIGRGDVVDELELRRRFVAGYRWLCDHDPERLAHLQSTIEQLEAELAVAHVEPERLAPPSIAATIRTIVILLIILPLALAGAAIHYPAYRLIGFISTRINRDEELVATLKAIGGMLFFPLTWIACAAIAWWRFGIEGALIVVALLPVAGWFALWFFENANDIIGKTRALLWRVARRQSFARFRDERRKLRDEIMTLADRASGSPAVATAPSPQE